MFKSEGRQNVLSRSNVTYADAVNLNSLPFNMETDYRSKKTKQVYRILTDSNLLIPMKLKITKS